MSDLRVLISEKIQEPYGLFFCSGEGDYFPNGEESASGNVVTRSGQHFFYWTGWDADRKAVYLEDWALYDPDEGTQSWRSSQEYLDAVAEAAS